MSTVALVATRVYPKGRGIELGGSCVSTTIDLHVHHEGVLNFIAIKTILYK